MPNKTSKNRKILYAEETGKDSIIVTAYSLEFLLILAAVVAALRITHLVINSKLSTAWIYGALLGSVILVVLAIRLGKALRTLGALMEENARLKTAVRYLLEAHNAEVRDCSEAPKSAIPGTAGDGFKTMRIEEDGVHFRKAGTRVKCPFCEHEQPAGSDACEKCSQKFFFEE